MRHKNSRVSDPNEFKTHSGDTHHVQYESRLDFDGTVKLKESGRVDIQAQINSHAGETDMAVIVNRLMMGDTSVLTTKKPMYGDFTQFPRTYAEAFDLVNRSEQAFERLSPDIKVKYDNDVQKWFSSIGTEPWLSDLGLIDVVPTPDDGGVVE